MIPNAAADYWRFPLYREMIPKLMENPRANLSYSHSERCWKLEGRKVEIKGEEWSPVKEIALRVFRELYFLFDKEYRTGFFAAKERLERTYKQSISERKKETLQEAKEKENLSHNLEEAKSAKKWTKDVLNDIRNALILEEKRHQEAEKDLNRRLEELNRFYKVETDKDAGVALYHEIERTKGQKEAETSSHATYVFCLNQKLERFRAQFVQEKEAHQMILNSPLRPQYIQGTVSHNSKAIRSLEFPDE